MERCAKTAVEMENGTIVEEGDVEDQERGIELGKPANALILENTIRMQTFDVQGKIDYLFSCL